MADTRRTLSALQTLLADNSSGDISAADVRDMLVSVDGENSVQVGAFASIPVSAQKVGDLYLSTDGFCVYRWSGSAWVPWGPIFPFADPALQTFSWVNQDAATLATTKGGVFLTAPSKGGSDSINARVKSAPATPYTITAAYLFAGDVTSTSTNAGLLFRESGSGKIHAFQLNANAGTLTLYSLKYGSATAFSAIYTNNAGPPRPIYFVRIADDGANRICSYSADGQNFIAFHSVGRTDYLTADQVGFFINPYSGQCNMTLLSWKEG